jgi:hypothetical protein
MVQRPIWQEHCCTDACMATAPGESMSQRCLSGRLRAAQVEGFIGTDAVLRSWEQKQALLTALRPRDRLRLLGLVRLATDASTGQTVIS